MDTINNVTQLLIGKAVTETALTDLTLITSGSQFNDGEIFVADQFNRYLDGTTAATNGLYKYGQARGSEILWSDIIDLKNNLNSYAIGSAEAEAEQIDYVGSNGVTGDIDGVASNIYTIRLNILDKTTAGFMQQKIKEGFYKTNAQASSYTQQAIAEGLVKSLIANYSRETEQDLAFGVINSGARTASSAATGTLTVTHGSKYVLASVDITAEIAVGDLVAVDSEVTTPVYRVVAIDAATETAELDHAYQGGTETVAAATWDFVAAATAAAADYGVKINGEDRQFKAGYYWSNVIFWETQIDFSVAAPSLITNAQAPYPGVGTGDYIANLEKELQADEFIYRGFPEAGVVDRADAVAGSGITYDVQVIEHEHNLKSAQGTPTESPKTLMIAWYKVNATAAAVVAIQEDLFDFANVTYVTQAGNLTT